MKRSARVRDVLAGKLTLPMVISVGPEDPLIKAIRLMHVYNISQLPVFDGPAVAGTLSEADVLESLQGGADPARTRIADLMTAPLPQVDQDDELQKAYGLLRNGGAAVLVRRGAAVVGLVTRSDLIAFWSIGRETPPYQI